MAYQYNTAVFSPHHATASAHRNIAPDRIALAARHPVPRITLDACILLDIMSLSLELAPSILLLGRSLTTVVDKHPDPSSSHPSRLPMLSPGAWQTSIPSSKSVDIRNSNNAFSEWYLSPPLFFPPLALHKLSSCPGKCLVPLNLESYELPVKRLG